MALLELGDYVPYLLNRVGSRLAEAFSKVLRDNGITLHMWRALVTIHHEDGIRAGELAAATSLERSTVSRVLGALVKMDLVRREHETEDARAVTVHLTPSGRELVQRLIPHALHYEKLALAGFSEDEIVQLKHLLRRLFDNLSCFAGGTTRSKQENVSET